MRKMTLLNLTLNILLANLRCPLLVKRIRCYIRFQHLGRKRFLEFSYLFYFICKLLVKGRRQIRLAFPQGSSSRLVLIWTVEIVQFVDFLAVKVGNDLKGSAATPLEPDKASLARRLLCGFELYLS
jgi:hypothetical protein